MDNLNSHDNKLKDFVLQHQYFWWWVPQNALANNSLSSIIEGTLNFGDIPDIKQLFEIVGIEKVAGVFYKTKELKGRSNYFPITKNYFDLYFNQHVPEYSNRGTSSINSGN